MSRIARIRRQKRRIEPADTVGRCIRLLCDSSCAVAILFLDFLLLDLVSKHLPSVTNLKKIVPVYEGSAWLIIKHTFRNGSLLFKMAQE